MPRYRVLPYRGGSRGATSLSRALNGRCLKVDGTSRFRPRRDDVLINWGNTNNPDMVQNCTMNNVDLRQASNKLSFFRQQSESGNAELLPRFWTAQEEIPEDGFPVVCRTVLSGHSGDGIVIANTRDELVRASLYVQYVKKQDEYRIHVGRGRRMDGPQSIIISVQRKARSRAVPDDQVNWQVRNHTNGFIYMRENVVAPDAVIDVAKRVLEATNLDFGAVDVIWNERAQRAYVLEINTAPGLEGTTLDDYVRYFTA